MTSINNIQAKFKQATIVEKIIYINIVFFVVSIFLNQMVIDWFSLKSDINYFSHQPWTIISYGFFHTSFTHILFNLIFLFYIGNLFLDFFSSKQFINYYIFGIITGGIAYILLQSNGILLGASAGIMAILVGIATKIPNFEIRLALIGNIKLWIIALLYIGISLIGLQGDNIGGNIAHLGGALIGFIYTKQLERGTDIGKWIETLINFITNLFKKREKNPFKKVYRNKDIKRRDTHKESQETQRKIDQILDKISKSGYAALTKEEKDFLFKAGKK